MRTALRRMGNSSGIILPKAILDEVGARTGEEFDVTVSEGKIVAIRCEPKVRAGWAEAAARLATDGYEPAWPEFGNDGDAELFFLMFGSSGCFR